MTARRCHLRVLVEALRADREIAAALAEGAALTIMPLVLDAGRAVRVNLSLDAGLLDATDEAAKAHTLLPRRYFDHPLSSEWSDHRDCHIRPNLVLIYRWIVENKPCTFSASGLMPSEWPAGSKVGSKLRR
jgi:addiction module RelE/StbE family toxin